MTLIVWLFAAGGAIADEVESTIPNLDKLSARQAVHEGNRLLSDGKPEPAIEAYTHAESLRPEAREIAFGQGLAQYDRGEFEYAREAFKKAAAWETDELADDAIYSLGTCDHAEGLNNLEDPKAAISLLENAMHRYQDVLKRRPDHSAARDANRKAAATWRQIKQQLQQQEQQQQDQNQDSDENKEDSDQQQQEDQKGDRQEEQEDQQSQEQDEQQQEEQDASQDQKEQEQQQASQAEQKEQDSREQAQRKLREMMQDQRERKKTRREQIPIAPVAPVDKDW